VDSEVVLPRRALPQPSPHVVPGGDCGACVLGALLGLTVAEFYPWFDEGKVEALSWHTVRQALFQARSDRRIDRLVDDVPTWPSYEAQANWGSPGWTQNMEWFHRVRMAIDGGYYGLCSVDFAARGPMFGHDHFVMICGAREVTRPHPTVEGAGTIDQEVLVSCSASNVQGYWIEAREFLKTRGGFNVLLARPVARL
jgi:hypothetical protein